MHSHCVTLTLIFLFCSAHLLFLNSKYKQVYLASLANNNNLHFKENFNLNKNFQITANIYPIILSNTVDML